MPWAPHVTVAAVIRREDRYLMVEEAPEGQIVINQPAGHLEPDETLVDAVAREVREETGRHFFPSGIVGIYQWSLPGSDNSYLRFCFAGDVSAPDTDRGLDPDVIATHWMTREQIVSGPRPPRSPLVIRCIDDASRHPPLELGLLRHVSSTDR